MKGGGGGGGGQELVSVAGRRWGCTRRPFHVAGKLYRGGGGGCPSCVRVERMLLGVVMVQDVVEKSRRAGLIFAQALGST